MKKVVTCIFLVEMHQFLATLNKIGHGLLYIGHGLVFYA